MRKVPLRRGTAMRRSGIRRLLGQPHYFPDTWEVVLKKHYLFIGTLCVAIIALSVYGYAASAKKPLQSNIERGMYIHQELVTKDKIPGLPIPLTNEDYVILQSIGKVTNIVIGKFKTGDRTITLITDSNADGTVDSAYTWYVDDNKLDTDPKPETTYSVAQFAQMKEEIVNGKSARLSPNSEGIPYMRMLLKKPSNITKMRNGFRVSGTDPDINLERVSFFFSDNNVNGADLAFEVKYINVGQIRMLPIITIGVYCKDSFDPFVSATAKKLSAEAVEFYRTK